jgi:RNA polymerase sigma factor (sigma-70 family)
MTRGTEGLAGLVVEVQRLKREGIDVEVKKITSEILIAVKPVLLKATRHFAPSARGSLSEEDLLQVGAIAVLKLLNKYDHEKRGTWTFEGFVLQDAKRAMRDQIWRHSADVMISEGARRGRTKKEVDVRVSVVSSDAATLRKRSSVGGSGNSNNGEEEFSQSFASASLQYQQVEHDTPEALLVTAQEKAGLRKAIGKLPAQHREIVAWVYGIGRPSASARDVAAQMDLPRTKVTKLLEEALAMLRGKLSQ